MELRVGRLERMEDIRTIGQAMEAIFVLPGYCREETPIVHALLDDGLRNLTQVADHAVLEKVIWASNVSVYGNPKANVKLDENSPCKPTYPLGADTLKAEKRLAAALPTVLLRVTSIYGPGRDYIQALREGRVRLLNGGKNWQSRIHVDDLVTALVAGLERGEPGETYLAADDQPTTSYEFFSELTQALGLPLPPSLEVNAARAFGTAGKALNWLAAGQNEIKLNENVIGMLTSNYNCANNRLKERLGVALKYPSYLDAYEEMLKQ
jgi:nucleoside-diphosphate-sugar epimerase